MYITLLKGLVIGFVIAVPIGPIGLLCINRGISFGAAYGFFSWLGVATGDALVGSITVLGLTMISDFLVSQHAWLHAMVGLILCYFGLQTFFARVVGPIAAPGGKAFLNSYTSTLFLTVSNPMTFAAFFAIYAGWGVTIFRGEYLSAALLGGAIFIGTALWWLVLGGALALCRDRVTDSVTHWIQLVSGAVIAGCGFGLIMWS